MNFQPQQQHSYYADSATPQNAVERRAKFIERTYLHLAGAIAAFVALEAVLLNTPASMKLAAAMISGKSWLLVLGLFMGVGWLATHLAQSARSKPAQYLGLGLYVVAEAIIFLPLLLIASIMSGEGNNIILTAGVSTLATFAALTGIVLATKRDFSWMRSALMVISVGVLILIVASLLFGFTLGIGFTVGMIVLAACYILYDTSNVLHHYDEDQYVSASLALFASVALLFWYVLRLVMSLQSRD